MKSRRTILSDIKSLQILISVTWNQVLALKIWPEKMHGIGRKFSQHRQGIVVSRRDFGHSWVTKMPLLKLFYNWHDQSHGGPVSRQTKCATCEPTIMRDWWYDLARLVARSCTTYLRHLAICNRGSWVLNMTIDLAVTKFARRKKSAIFFLVFSCLYMDRNDNIWTESYWIGK